MTKYLKSFFLEEPEEIYKSNNVDIEKYREISLKKREEYLAKHPPISKNKIGKTVLILGLLLPLTIPFMILAKFIRSEDNKQNRFHAIFQGSNEALKQAVADKAPKDTIITLVCRRRAAEVVKNQNNDPKIRSGGTDKVASSGLLGIGTFFMVFTNLFIWFSDLFIDRDIKENARRISQFEEDFWNTNYESNLNFFLNTGNLPIDSYVAEELKKNVSYTNFAPSAPMMSPYQYNNMANTPMNNSQQYNNNINNNQQYSNNNINNTQKDTQSNRRSL